MSVVRVFEPVQGYGSAIRRRIAEPTSDLIVPVSPTARSTPTNCRKLLHVLSDSDSVLVGSRTVQSYMYTGANCCAVTGWWRSTSNSC